MKDLCPNKELCGSCSWSHIPYEKQLKQKLSDINGSFALKELEITCHTILPSPKLEHYRNRMDYVIDYQGKVGMRQKDKWWRVLDDHTCFLADDRIDELYGLIRIWVQASGLSYYDRRAHIGLLRFAVVRATRLGESMIVILTSPPKDADEEQNLHAAFTSLIESVKPTTLVWGINSTQSDVSFGETYETIFGLGVICESVGDVRYRISPNAFFQTNSFAAPLLLETVLSLAGNLEQKTVLDLYCGTGFFSVAMAKSAKRVIGIELNAEAIADANMNATLNHVSPEFTAAPTEESDWSIYEPDVVILDPPRSGMHDKALADIIRIQPKEIIYVSCNYKNFTREMVQLQNIYQITDMIAIDQFPHTPHVELVTKLIKKNS